MKINKLKQFRTFNSIKQETMAKMLGICQSYVSQLESSQKRNKFKVSQEILQKMKDAGIKGNPFEETEIEDCHIRSNNKDKVLQILVSEKSYADKRIFLKDILHTLNIDLVFYAAKTGLISFEVFYKKDLIYTEKAKHNIHFSSL